MRQKLQTPDDVKFRTALENMRYKACTPEDVIFLRSRVSANFQGRSSICEANFRSVSIITARHVNKDAINELGAIRYAAENGDKLQSFYCEDTVQPISDKAAVKNRRRHVKVNVSESVQKLLWQQPSSSVDKKIPARLQLCKGLPVMLRSNSATELCMTNGQEGTVYGWRSTIGVYGQSVLDVLFVKLSNPAQSVTFDGLPENVVPVMRTVTPTTCTLPSGDRLYVSRSQVEVSVNYAMTDFASQGKTRLYNVVHLNDTTTHQGYYTALSRSASAAGTLILQGFDPRIISGKKCSGALRQEFRDLELLDEITRLRFEGLLHHSVVGDTRRALIHTFRLTKSANFVPKFVHPAIRWSKKDPYVEVHEPLTHVDGDNGKYSSDIPASSTEDILAKPPAPDKSTLKRAKNANSEEKLPKRLRTKIDIAGSVHPPMHQLAPLGCQWSDNSCAYDTVLTLLYNIWLEKQITVDLLVEMSDNALQFIITSFNECCTSQSQLDSIKEQVHLHLHNHNQGEFQYGAYTSVSALLNTLLTSAPGYVTNTYTCTNNHVISRSESLHSSFLLLAGASQYESVNSWTQNLNSTTRRICVSCSTHVNLTFDLALAPYVIAFDFADRIPNVLDHKIYIHANGNQVKYHLKGIIYFGRSHFIARFIDKAKRVWHYDGMDNNGMLIYETDVISSIDLKTCNGMSAIIALYARVPLVRFA
ncbi:hypothetical protein PLEOSDRAFT_1047729 [Pleurotus ostreatus PC15]|uniref:DNA helicase n=1 Tax=Pleurotus ostreatus (strain PC15) TaxID=1137138 RepID=A0A067NLT0_PLEO1|nr:hypothetical protein PLEOSDRAFT_1047729 [Pleurotus ostreatus PC15]